MLSCLVDGMGFGKNGLMTTQLLERVLASSDDIQRRYSETVRWVTCACAR